MFRPVTFAPAVENLVRFVEETEPVAIVGATLDKLRGGVTPKMLLTAGALAVTRSTELPAQHHGGPIHPVCGTFPVYHTAQLLSGELAYLPIIQHVALCNKHIHALHMGPAILPAMEPQAAGDGSIEATKEALLGRLRGRHPAAAEKHALWLLEHVPGDEVLDVLLTAAIPRNGEDDHFFLYPTFTARALDCVGWEWAPVLLRPPVRFLCGAPYYNNAERASGLFGTIESLIREHRLLEIDLSLHSSSGETEAIGALAEEIGRTEEFATIPALLAQAMADGLSLEGAGEALSIGGASIYLRSHCGNPMDVHIHTGVGIRRYLLARPGVSLRNKLTALFNLQTGIEVRVTESKMKWQGRADPEAIAALPDRTQHELLGAIRESIEGQPEVDMAAVGPRVDLMVAPPEVQETMALAQQYSGLGYDPVALFALLAELACRDDYTEMHVFKHHQAAVEQFHTTREPFRWVHMVSAAKAAAVIHGKRQHVYREARELLRA